MTRNLAGKRVLITGASSGIGREIAVALAGAGGRLLLTSNKAEQLDAVAADLAGRSAEVFQIAGDIATPEDRAAIFAAAKERWGGLDILINNAGVGGNAPFAEEHPSVLRRIMEVNFLALAECCRLGIPLLAQGNQPLIVNMSSMFGRRAVPNWSSYCASKFAVCGFSEALRSELALSSIDLMLVLPGVVRTDFGKNLISGEPTTIHLGSDPKVVAQTVLSGMEQNRSELQIGQDSRRLIFLNRLFPGRLFPTWPERKMLRFARHLPAPASRRARLTDVNHRSFRSRRICFVRAAERALPARLFNAAVFPFLLFQVVKNWSKARAARQMLKRSAATRSASPLRIAEATYRRLAMGQVRHWPDRLREPRWQRRCRVVGEENLRAAQASGRPIVLASVHYGDLNGLFYWLRSRGVPVAAMAAATRLDAYRLYYDSLADQANGMAGLPSLFGTATDDLFGVRDFLSQPRHVLLMAIDVPWGSHPVIIELEDATVAVKLGAFSLAAMTNAIVLPCLFRATGGMGCEIYFGTAVPDEFLSTRKTYASAARHVLEQLMPPVRRWPEQSELEFVGRAA